MKTKLTIVTTAILLGIGFISMQRSTANAGSVKITCMADDEPIAEALVGVSTSEENLENSKYIFEGETNSTGVIYYKSVAPGTYYIDANKDEYYGEAKVTVTDSEVSVTVTMSEDDED